MFAQEALKQFNQHFQVDLTSIGWTVEHTYNCVVDNFSKTICYNTIQDLSNNLNIFNVRSDRAYGIYFQDCNDKVQFKPNMKELFELLFPNPKVIFHNRTVAIVDGKDGIYGAEWIPEESTFSSRGISPLAPMLIKNGIFKNDKIYYGLVRHSDLRFGEGGVIQVPASMSDETNVRYTEILLDTPNLLKVKISKYRRGAEEESSATIYTVALNEQKDINIVAEKVGDPWLKNQLQNIQLIKTPNNISKWIFFTDDPKYVGDKLFITSKHNCYIRMEGIWVEVMSRSITSDLPKGHPVRDEYEMWLQLSNVEEVLS